MKPGDFVPQPLGGGLWPDGEPLKRPSLCQTRFGNVNLPQVQKARLKWERDGGRPEGCLLVHCLERAVGDRSVF